MIDAGIGTGTSEPRISAGIGLGVNAGATAAGPPTEVRSVAAAGMRFASAALLPAGTSALLGRRGADNENDPAAASPLTAPAMHRTPTAVRSVRLFLNVRMSAFSFSGQQPEP